MHSIELDSWAKEMAAVVETVVKVDALSMGSSDGQVCSLFEAKKIVEQFTESSYYIGIPRIGYYVISSKGSDKQGIVVDMSETDYCSLQFFDETLF